MFAFAAPAALIGLAALAVPIVLHLWSRLTGRPLRVGTVAWFAAAPPPVARKPQIEDPWLLLLRCTVLAALVLALAEPYWRSSKGTRSTGVWALIAREAAADPRSKPVIDSLRASGAEVHELGAGQIWSLLREADHAAPPGTRFVVVAPPTGAEGERPTLKAPVSWMPHPLSPSPESGEGERRLSRRVVVYSDNDRRDDAKYVTAALRAAGEATGQPAIVTQRDASSLGGDADWVVWLAARPVPAELLEQASRGATLLTDLSADTAPVPGAPVWTDGSGRPTLTLTRLKMGRRYAYSSRFHPAAGNLVLRAEFPEAMAALWSGESDRRPSRVAISQLVPARDSTDQRSAPARHDLYHVFWLGAVALFALERVVAHRARATTA